MASINALLGAEGGVTYAHGNDVRKVKLINQAVAGDFGLYLEEYEESLLKRLRAFLPADEYAKEAAEFARKLKDGDFEFHSDAAKKELQKPRHALQFASMLFGVSREEMARLMTADEEGVKAVLDRVIRLSAPEPKEGDEGNG